MSCISCIEYEKWRNLNVNGRSIAILVIKKNFKCLSKAFGGVNILWAPRGEFLKAMAK